MIPSPDLSGLPPRADAVVVGSGFAGLGAAVRLADRGRRVVVIEEAPRLGGRATSFSDRETGERVDNGQHALFGCYRETYAFLARIGAAHLAPLQPRLSVTMAGEGRVATLSCPKLPSPMHLLAGLMTWRGVGIADRWTAMKLVPLLRAVRSQGAEAVANAVDPDLTVSAWLRAQGQSPALCRWLWNPLAIAALNQSPDVAAAAPFVRVLAELFGADPAAASIGLASVPLDDLFAAPAAEFISSKGGQVLSRTRATVAVGSRGEFVVRAGAVQILTPTLVSAVPWHAFSRLWENGVPPGLEAISASASATKASPIVTVNLWMSDSGGQPELPRLLGFVDGPMHWMFNKGKLVQGLRHLSLVASGADDLAGMENADITRAAFAQLQSSIPAARTCVVDRSVVVREHRATFSLAPGGPRRPPTRTPLSGFYLAGDWTDTGLPGTIEGAVKSGHAAAEAALSAQSGM